MEPSLVGLPAPNTVLKSKTQVYLRGLRIVQHSQPNLFRCAKARVDNIPVLPEKQPMIGEGLEELPDKIIEPGVTGNLLCWQEIKCIGLLCQVFSDL